MNDQRVANLLKIVELSLGHPKLKVLREAALKELEKEAESLVETKAPTPPPPIKRPSFEETPDAA